MGATAAALASWGHAPARDFWLWCAVCFASERLWLRLPVGDATITMASCCNAAAILLLPAGQAMTATALSALLAEMVFMRKSAERATYNAAQSGLSAGAAAMAYAWLRPHAGDVVGAITGLTLYWVINTWSVSLAIALHEGLSITRVWRANFGHRYEMIATGALFSIGSLVAGHVREHGPAALLFALLPMLAAWEGWRYFLTRRATAARDDRLRDAA